MGLGGFTMDPLLRPFPCPWAPAIMLPCLGVDASVGFWALVWVLAWIYRLIAVDVGWMWVTDPAPTLIHKPTLNFIQTLTSKHTPTPILSLKDSFFFKKNIQRFRQLYLANKKILSLNRFGGKGKFLSVSIHTVDWLLFVAEFTFIVFMREFTNKSSDRLGLETPKEKMSKEKISNNYM